MYIFLSIDSYVLRFEWLFSFCGSIENNIDALASAVVQMIINMGLLTLRYIQFYCWTEMKNSPTIPNRIRIQNLNALWWKLKSRTEKKKTKSRQNSYILRILLLIFFSSNHWSAHKHFIHKHENICDYLCSALLFFL